jgi:hypothetical protein
VKGGRWANRRPKNAKEEEDDGGLNSSTLNNGAQPAEEESRILAGKELEEGVEGRHC